MTHVQAHLVLDTRICEVHGFFVLFLPFLLFDAGFSCCVLFFLLFVLLLLLLLLLSLPGTVCAAVCATCFCVRLVLFSVFLLFFFFFIPVCTVVSVLCTVFLLLPLLGCRPLNPTLAAFDLPKCQEQLNN